MEDSLVYKVECYFGHYCVRVNNGSILFVTEGKLYEQLTKIREAYDLYKFINENVRITDELVASCYIFQLQQMCDYCLMFMYLIY